MRVYHEIKALDRFECVFLGVFHMCLGTAVVVGGANRFSGPTYEPLLTLANGEVWKYGLLYLTAGLLMLTKTFWLTFFGLLLGVLVNSIFVGMFFKAVIDYPDAGATAWVAYLGYAVMDSILMFQVTAHRGLGNQNYDGGG